MTIDIPTLILAGVALAAIILIAVSFPRVLAQHREDVRRRLLGPLGRAMEDAGVAFSRVGAAFDAARHSLAAFSRAFDGIGTVGAYDEADERTLS